MKTATMLLVLATAALGTVACVQKRLETHEVAFPSHIAVEWPVGVKPGDVKSVEVDGRTISVARKP